MTLCSLTKV
ncbi:hypothetical protein D039_2487A, partial [Vibrio parahaemolyticus EKP-028]